MNANHWNVPKVAAIGAIAGALFVSIQHALGTTGAPASAYVGLAIGGALLFGLVAIVRNTAARS